MMVSDEEILGTEVLYTIADGKGLDRKQQVLFSNGTGFSCKRVLRANYGFGFRQENLFTVFPSLKMMTCQSYQIRSWNPGKARNAMRVGFRFEP